MIYIWYDIWYDIMIVESKLPAVLPVLYQSSNGPILKFSALFGGPVKPKVPVIKRSTTSLSGAYAPAPSSSLEEEDHTMIPLDDEHLFRSYDQYHHAQDDDTKRINTHQHTHTTTNAVDFGLERLRLDLMADSNLRVVKKMKVWKGLSIGEPLMVYPSIFSLSLSLSLCVSLSLSTWYICLFICLLLLECMYSFISFVCVWLLLSYMDLCVMHVMCVYTSQFC